MFSHSPTDMRRGYRKRFELAVLVAVALMLCAFYASRRVAYSYDTEPEFVPPDIEVVVMPRTKQPDRPKPPTRPQVPIPTEDEDIPDDMTIAPTELRFGPIPPPPPPPIEEADENHFKFIEVSQKPVLIGEMPALMWLVKYPELARKAGITGTVSVGALIDVDGSVKKAIILHDSGTNVGFEQAALNAILQTRWEPAMQRDRVVKVWVEIPIRFRLKQ